MTFHFDEMSKTYLLNPTVMLMLVTDRMKLASLAIFFLPSRGEGGRGGVLPVVDHTGRFRPKEAPFSGSRFFINGRNFASWSV